MRHCYCGRKFRCEHLIAGVFGGPMELATPYWLYVLFLVPPILLLIMIVHDWVQGNTTIQHPLDTQPRPSAQKRAS